MFRKLTQLGAVIAPLTLAAIAIVGLTQSVASSLYQPAPWGMDLARTGGVALHRVAEAGPFTQMCVQTRAQFDAFTEAQRQTYGPIKVTEMPAEVAKPYFVEIDKLPPATKTVVDTAVLIEVRAVPATVWVAAVHKGMVCNRCRISRVTHETIMTIAARSPKATGLKI